MPGGIRMHGFKLRKLSGLERWTRYSDYERRQGDLRGEIDYGDLSDTCIELLIEDATIEIIDALEFRLLELCVITLKSVGFFADIILIPSDYFS